MPNYRESSVSGSRWWRGRTVICHNPLDGPQSVDVLEEEVVQVGGQTLTRDVGHVSIAFDANGSIPLLDPATDEPTGQTMSHAALYQALYSLYRQAAAARDAEQE